MPIRFPKIKGISGALERELLEDAEKTATHIIPEAPIGEETKKVLTKIQDEAKDNFVNPMVQDIQTAQQMKDVANKVESYKSPVAESLERYKAGTSTPEDHEILAKAMGEKQLPSAENPIIIPDSKENYSRSGTDTTKKIDLDETVKLQPEEPLKSQILDSESFANSNDTNSHLGDFIQEANPKQNILDSEYIKKTNPSLYESFKSLSPVKKAALLGSLGIGGAYSLNSLKSDKNDDSIKPPTIPSKKQEIVNKPEEDEVKAIKDEKQSVKEEISKLEKEASVEEHPKTFLQNLLKVEGTNLGSDENLKEAQRKRDQELAMNTLGRAANTITGAILHTGPTLENFYNQQDRQAERHIEDIKERISNEKNDPNSSVSNAYKQILEQFGVKTEGPISASAVEKIAPWVEKKYLAEEGRKAKIEEMKYKYKELGVKEQSAKQAKIEMRNDDFIFKANQALSKTKPFLYRQKIDNSINTIEAAIKNPNAVNDIAALYDFVKGLDPDSAVREGEVKLGREALGLWGQIKSDISKAGTNPRLLDTKMLENVRKYLQVAKIGAENQYKSVAAPLLKQAESRGIPKERHSEIDPFISLDQQSQSSNSEVTSQYTPQQESIIKKYTDQGYKREDVIKKLHLK